MSLARSASHSVRLAPPLGLSLALLIAPARAEGWGFEGHRRIARAAVERLPEPLRGFFAANVRTIAEHSIDPDLWRAAGREGEDPNHYINIDLVSLPPFHDVPEDEAEFLARFGPKARAAGRLPWSIGDAFGELASAYASRDGDAIRARAAVLAHYVSDLHVPLHLTRNHDGHETGQAGIHRRWESELVERYQEQIAWRGGGGPLAPSGPAVAFAFERVRRCYPGVEGILSSDRSAVGGSIDFFETPGDDRYDGGYFSRLFALEQARLEAQIASAVDGLASLWLQAWIDVGKPELPAGVADRFVRGQARAILMSWDGASESWVERLLEQEKLPNLARLASRGVSFDHAISSYPTKTAAAHAAIYTGATARVNGVSGNEVPFPPGSGRTVLDWISGYDSRALRAEPLWITAARQGLRAVSFHSTQSHPFEPFLSEKRFGADFGRNALLFNGYAAAEEGDFIYGREDLDLSEASGWSGLPPHHGAALELVLPVWGKEVYGALVDTTEDPRPGFDRLVLALSKQSRAQRLTLEPRPARAGVAQGESLLLENGSRWGSVFFRLFELSPDGSELLLYRSRVYAEAVSRPELARPFLEQVGGFQGNGPSDLYRSGALGPTLPEGGDGTAERRYLDVLELVYRQFARATELVLSRMEWDILFHYLPFPDDPAHLWYGFLDPSLPSHDPEVARRLAPQLEEIYRMNDRVLGMILDRSPENTVFVLASDHGFAGTDRVVYPNVTLRKAGLLALDDSGAIDPSRSRILYQPEDTAYLRINRIGFEEGLVPPEEEESVLVAARRALEAVRDPETGASVFTGFYRPGESAAWGIGGPWGGDLYLDLAHGYRFASDADGSSEVERARPEGTHVFAPARPDMHAILYIAGPGVRKGIRTGPARLIDIAPTMSHLLGIEPPRGAEGRVLEEAIEDEDSR